MATDPVPFAFTPDFVTRDEFDKLASRVSSVETVATSAQSTALSAQSTALSAQSTALSAQSTADAAAARVGDFDVDDYLGHTHVANGHHEAYGDMVTGPVKVDPPQPDLTAQRIAALVNLGMTEDQARKAIGAVAAPEDTTAAQVAALVGLGMTEAEARAAVAKAKA